MARAIGCSPTTVGNELKRGTPPRKSSKGRKPGYWQGVEKRSTRRTESVLGNHTESVTALASFAG
ncbi:MAG: hypothetical protein ACLR0P_12855 [Oscillospiraceae bacterium]